MYIIVSKEDCAVINWGSEMDTARNGYPRLVQEDVMFVPDNVLIFETDSVPEDLIQNKYCYSEEEGFYANPGYAEPNRYGISEELLRQIKEDAVAEVQKEVTDGKM